MYYPIRVASCLCLDDSSFELCPLPPPLTPPMWRRGSVLPLRPLPGSWRAGPVFHQLPHVVAVDKTMVNKVLSCVQVLGLNSQ